MWPALIAAGASLLGSAISSNSQRRANEANEENQREFAQHGVRWKVEDAKAAGLHPLFALGGSGATYSPSAQPVFDQSLGQNLSRAASAFSDRSLQTAQLEAIQAATQKDRAIAAAYDSEAARNRQGMSATSPVAQSFPVDLPGVSINPQWSGEHIPEGIPGNPQALWPLTPGRPYLTNRDGQGAPSFKVWALPGIGEAILPDGNQFNEAVESIESLGLQAAVIAANVAHYGPGAVQRLKRFMGKAWSSPWEAAVDQLRESGHLKPFIRR